MADFSKMEYRDNSVDESKIRSIYNNSVEKALHPDSVDANSRNCNESSHVDFLYLSTIRGGRNMRRGGSCGCNMKGGENDLEVQDDIDQGVVDEGVVDEGVVDEGVDEGVDEVYNELEISGGCFKCKKGVKNIIQIYRSVHIIIPTLYSKYKKEISMKEKKIKKPINPKIPKSPKIPKIPKSPKSPKIPKNKK